MARILMRDGIAAVNTNRIAEVAGVSIGSVYQYFPNKQAIFRAVHERHIQEMGRIVGARLVEHANAPPDRLLRSLVEAMVAAHAANPRLHQLLSSEVPHGGTRVESEMEVRMKGMLRRVLSARSGRRRSAGELDRTLFVLTHMLDALSHAAVLNRPPELSLAEATDEAVGAVLAYVAA